MTPKHTIEIYDLVDHPDGTTVGYRVTSANFSLDLVTDADYLVHSLTETLSHIGQVMPDPNKGVNYPWPL